MNKRIQEGFKKQLHTSRKKWLSAKFIGSVLGIGIITLACFLIFDSSAMFLRTSGAVEVQTPERLPQVPETDNTFTIEWSIDSMDRGNHDLLTSFHGELVVSKEIKPMKRGDILYYQFQGEEQLGRLIGMPGETVKIQNGQVYVNGKELDTFYGEAASLGMTKEEYFKRVHSENADLDAMEEYFITSMEPVLVEENTAFVLVDMWWRGRDSREYGPIPYEQIQGIVLGYKQ